MICRGAPPYGAGRVEPGTVVSDCRTRYWPRSYNCRSLCCVELSANWITGTADAEKRITTGGWMPGGSCARIELVDAVTCDSARSMLTLGWK